MQEYKQHEKASKYTFKPKINKKSLLLLREREERQKDIMNKTTICSSPMSRSQLRMFELTTSPISNDRS
jgi:hypothetical protein